MSNQIEGEKNEYKSLLIDYYTNAYNINDTFKHMPKYYIIKRIPKLFLCFLGIFIALLLIIYFYNISKDNKYFIYLDKVINLITGFTIIVAGIYLWTVRSEYHTIIKDLYALKNLKNIQRNKLNALGVNTAEIEKEIDRELSENI